MTEIVLEVKEYYWAHRDVVRLAGGGAAIVLTQLVLMLWTLRRLRELSHLRERLSRLADGLALLTDTTEAGLSTIVEALRTPKKAAAPRAARAAVAKRVTTAARNGERIVAIAEREALSESEVRLHLALAQAQAEAEAAGRTRQPAAS